MTLTDDARPSWDATWLDIAEVMARRSRCRGGAGAVAVDFQQLPITTGYTGPPANYRLTEWENKQPTCASYCPRTQRDPSQRDLAYLDCPSVHAEVNLIARADPLRLQSGTIYISTVPCLNCAKAVSSCGLVRAVWRTTPADSWRDPKGAVAYLERCGIEAVVLA